MKYFENCITLEDVKKTYKQWAKKLHPDCGGDAEEFKRMSAEYQEAFERCKFTARNSKGETYHKDTTETADWFAGVVEKLLHMEGIRVEIIGFWIWVSGNTRPYKEEIKALGFFWSSSKSAWYYTGEKKKSTKRGQYSMNELRSMWGTTEVKSKGETKAKTEDRPKAEPCRAIEMVG